METSRYANVLEAMPDGVVLVDRRGTILYANAQAQVLSGYAAERLVGQRIELLVPTRLRAEHGHHRADFHRSGVPTRPMGTGLEILLRRADGTELPVDIALSALQDGDGDLVVASIRDASERRRVEATMREAERRWRALVDNVPLVVVALGPDGEVAYANPSLLALIGTTPDEIAGLSWLDSMVPPGARAEEAAVLSAGVEGFGAHVGPILAKDGSERLIAWFNTGLYSPEGAVIGTLRIGEDVTERERARERIEATNAVTTALLQGRPIDEVLQLVARGARRLVDGSLALIALSENDGASLVLRAADGPRAAEIRDQRLPLSGSMSEEVLRTGAPMVLANASDEAGDARAIDALGPIGPALCLPLAAVGERVLGTLSVANPVGGRPFDEDDLTVVQLFAAQAAVALEYARLQDELQRLAVIEDRERIARDLHDGVIQSLFAVGMSLQAAEAIPERTQSMQRVRDAVAAIDGVIRDLRNFIFGLGPDASADQHLDRTLNDLAAGFGDRAGMPVEVRIDRAVAGEASARAADLIQAAREALSNAARHSGASRVTLSLEGVDGEAHLVIADDGKGYDLAQSTGLGLGLQTLEERARAIGGSLEIDTAPGRGTVVRIRFPI